MEQMDLPLETAPEKKPEPENEEEICKRCGMPKVNGICNCNRPWTGPDRSPFRKGKR